MTNPLRRATHAIPLAALSLLLLSAGMCRQAEEPPPAGTPAGSAELAEPTAEQLEALAAERAAAEAEAAEREAALAAAERELAEREARLAAEEERLRQARALEAERQRLAAARAAAAERERQLAAREEELRQREEEVAWREEEAERAASEPTAAPAPSGVYEGSFDEPWREGEASPGTEPAAVRTETETAPPTVKTSIPPGELLEVQITDTLSSKTSRVGDTFSARLVRDLYDAGGTLVVPAGAVVRGRVTEAEPFRRGGGQALLGVEFTHIVVPPDQTVGIHASFVELGADRRKNRKKVIAGTVAGAVLGHILGGDGSKNVIIGAAVGAAATSAVVARARDKDAEIPAGEIITLRLEEVVTVEIRYGAVAER